MQRQEVLSLLERFPELIDGDDDLLHDLMTDAKFDLTESDIAPLEQAAKIAREEQLSKRPR